MSERKSKLVKILDGGLTLEMEGRPLADIGLEGLEVVDGDGRVVGQLEGFAVFAGETMKQAIERSLPPGCTLRMSAELSRLLELE